MSASADVVVIGAGIIGAACADALAACGFTVTIVEPGPVGGGTTAAGMGHIVVMDDSEAQFALTRYSTLLWQELSADLPRQAEFVRTGTLWVAADELEMDEVRRKHLHYSERGVETFVLDSHDIAKAEPKLRPGLAGALLVSGDCVVYPPYVAQFLVRRAGARVVCGEAIDASGRDVHLRDGLVLSAAAVVNATGVDAPRLMPELRIQPRKGHLLITDRYPSLLRHQLVELGYLKSAHGHTTESVAMNPQPRATGQILIGSSRQLGVDSREVEQPVLARMLDRAIEYLPGLSELKSIRAWTGVRPCSPDNLPYIGAVPGDDAYFAAAGHEGLGITTSLATGQLIASLITRRECPIAPEPYSPRRVHARSH